jgi:hypothetical protein
MVKEKKSGNFVHTRILAMEATLEYLPGRRAWVYMDKGINCCGKVSRAWSNMCTDDSRVGPKICLHTRLASSSDGAGNVQLSWEMKKLSQEIQFALVEKAKNGHLNATVLIDVILSPEMQVRLRCSAY